MPRWGGADGLGGPAPAVHRVRRSAGALADGAEGGPGRLPRRTVCSNSRGGRLEPPALPSRGARGRAEGVNKLESRATTQNSSPANLELDAAMRSGRLRHGGDPVLEWCVGNVVGRPDRWGNLYPAKQRPEQKIDAAVAPMMAVGRATEARRRRAASSIAPNYGRHSGARQSCRCSPRTDDHWSVVNREGDAYIGRSRNPPSPVNSSSKGLPSYTNGRRVSFAGASPCIPGAGPEHAHGGYRPQQPHRPGLAPSPRDGGLAISCPWRGPGGSLLGAGGVMRGEPRL